MEIYARIWRINVTKILVLPKLKYKFNILASTGTAHMWLMNIYAGKTPTHKNKNERKVIGLPWLEKGDKGRQWWRWIWSRCCLCVWKSNESIALYNWYVTKIRCKGWRDGSVTKNTDCFSRDQDSVPRTHRAAHNLLSLSSRVRRPLLDSLSTCTQCPKIQIINL